MIVPAYGLQSRGNPNHLLIIPSSWWKTAATSWRADMALTVLNRHRQPQGSVHRARHAFGQPVQGQRKAAPAARPSSSFASGPSTP